MTQPPIPVPFPDAADKLAQRTIDNFCNALVKFGGDQMAYKLKSGGFKLPFAPLAKAIRECAAELNAKPAEPPPNTAALKDWFGAAPDGEDQKIDGVETVTSKPIVIVDDTGLTPESIIKTIAGRKIRIADLAAELKTTKEELAAVIALPDSGLSVNGPGWVSVKAA